MKPLIIYHADCTDGFGAAFAAWLKLGDEVEYLPMHYGDIDTHLDYTGRELYILDFSFPREVMEHMFANAERVVWLDHHKTAFEMWCPSHPRYYIYDDHLEGRYILLDNNKSGALLAWEYFHPNIEVPTLIRHIDDRDRWQFKIEGSKEVHAALSSMKPWSFEQWEGFVIPFEHEWLADVGAHILRAQDAHVKSMVKHARKCRIPTPTPDPLQVKALQDEWDLRESQAKAEVAEMNPLIGLAVNTPMHQSEVGHELANRSGTFGLVYYIGDNNLVRCSLRSDGDYDVSAIARSFGGGGHRNAAGFETDVSTLMGWLK